MTGKIHTVLTIVLLFVSGCASETIYLLPNSQPPKDTGVLYGRFNLTAIPSTCNLEVGLVLKPLKEDNPKEYIIKFDRTDGVIAMPIKAGEYVIDSVAFLTRSGSEHSRKTLDHHKGIFVVKSGKAYYLGDFEANTKCSSGPQGLTSSWGMKDVGNKFLATTTDFSNKYVQFDKYEKLPAYDE